MRRILIEKEYVNPRECSYGFPWDSDGTCYNFKSPNECVKSSEIDNIENLEDVETLVIGCDLQDYGFISKCKNLTQLYIYTGSNITDLSFLEKLYKVNHLYIGRSKVNSLEPLERLVEEKSRLMSETKDLWTKISYGLEGVYIVSEVELDIASVKDEGHCIMELIVNGKAKRAYR